MALLSFTHHPSYFNDSAREVSLDTKPHRGPTVTDSLLTMQAATPPVEVEREYLHRSLGRLGMWAFLMSDAVTFAPLLVSSGLLRVWSQDWPAPATVLHLPVAGVMTGFLLASSIAMAVSLTALKQGHQSRFRVALLFTIIGGGVFLLLQTWEWSHLIRQGLTLANNT